MRARHGAHSLDPLPRVHLALRTRLGVQPPWWVLDAPPRWAKARPDGVGDAEGTAVTVSLGSQAVWLGHGWLSPLCAFQFWNTVATSVCLVLPW